RNNNHSYCASVHSKFPIIKSQPADALQPATCNLQPATCNLQFLRNQVFHNLRGTIFPAQNINSLK
ncbi:TPA: hypothetical protein ACP7UV_003778, partial [Escherichia coli]